MKTEKHPALSSQGKIWIDLDNSPHVPFFAPIIQELRKRGCSVVLTARDCFQVRELADLFHLDYKLIGHHSGKNNLLKLAGLCLRAVELIPTVLSEEPELALSHGSRSQLIVSTILGIPSLTLTDYEFSTGWALIRPSWVICPDRIPDAAVKIRKSHLLKYPGIKEDVYVPGFKPNPGIRAYLGLDEEDLVVTVRPPADEAHYHNPESDRLFGAIIDFVGHTQNTRIILLPRNQRQAASLRETWPDLFASGKILVPKSAVDGLNLIWFSDLVISGGGTMNREAAALGVPVYSTFRGKIGAVDRYLAEQGRLTLIERVDEIRTKIMLVHRNRPNRPENGSHPALQAIVTSILAILESKRTKITE